MNTLTGYSKSTLTDSYLLTAAGGHKAISDFVTLDTALTISGVKTFSSLQKFIVAAGTAPFIVNSDSKVTNLNADYLGDYHETSFFRKRDMSASNVNFNNYFTNGVYINTTGNGTGNSNVPSTYGYLLAFLGGGSTSYYGGALIHIGTNGNLLTRAHWDYNWSTWKTILDSSNSSVTGDGGSTWGSSITVKINGTSKTLTIPSNPNTDTKVTLTVTSSDASYPLLLAPSGQTATTTTSAYFDSGVTLNPSTNTIAANISGGAARLHSNSAKNVGGLTYNYAGGITSSTDATGAFAGPSTSTTYSSVLRLLSHITPGGLYYRDLIFDVNSDSIWSRRVTNSGAPSLTSILHSGNSSVSGGGSSWGSSITVKINGTEKTLTIPSNPNTWRPITDTYEGTSLSSDTSLSLKGANSLQKNIIAFKRAKVTNENYDANTLLEGVIYNYYGYSAWKNAPTGMLYGKILNLIDGTDKALSGLLAWDINHASTTDTTRYLWWRATDNGTFKNAKWHRLAYADEIPTIPSLSLGTTTGTGNAVTSISVDGHKITLNKGTTFSTSGHTHYYLTTPGDKRSESTTPNSYSNKFIFLGLKHNSTIGSPSSDTYSYLVGLRGWSDYSGGNSWELAFNNTGMYARNGASTSWGAWKKFMFTSDIPSITATTTGSGNAITSVSASGHTITFTKGSTFSLSGHTHSHLVSGATLSGSDHAVALKTYFTNNYSSIPRNSLNTYRSSAMSNTSQYFGYFVEYHNDAPYGGFYVAHYDKPYYVGISNGTFTQHLLAKITDITKTQVGLSNVQNTAFYKRITTVNGTLWDMAGTNSTAAFTIYAPTTGGTAGYILKSNKDAAPTWIALSDISAGKLGGYEESKFLRSKGWVSAGSINDFSQGIYGTDIKTTDVPKDANGNNLTYSTVLSFDALVGSGYGKVLFYVKSASLYYRHYWDSKWYDWYLIALKSNIPTKVSQLLNDSGYLTTRGYIGTTSVLGSSAAQKLKGINGLYLNEDSSSAINNKGVNFCNSAGNIKHSIGASYGGFGIYSSGTLYIRAGCTASTSVDTAVTSSNTGLVLDASGNLTGTGNITANKFIKSGGTSSLFLKADGSVDSNTYLTSHQSLANYVTLNSAQTITGAKSFEGNLIIKRSPSCIWYRNSSNTLWGLLGFSAENTLTVWKSDASTSYEVYHKGNLGLVGANGTTGLIKNGSTVTTTTGLTACPIINGVPYYKELSPSGVTANTYKTYAEKWNSTARFLLLKIPQFTVNEYGILTNATYTATPIIRTHYIGSNLTWTNNNLSFINVFAVIPGVTLTLPGASIENCGKLIFAKKAYLGSAAYISGYITACNSYGTSAFTRSVDLINSSIFVCMYNGSSYSWVHFYCG